MGPFSFKEHPVLTGGGDGTCTRNSRVKGVCFTIATTPPYWPNFLIFWLYIGTLIVSNKQWSVKQITDKSATIFV